ncbi:MAG: hypothetical protein ACYC6N_24725 [Pirellulaceae bacterium]
MTAETTNEILNRLLVIHNRSLPIFLTYAPPWWKDGGGRMMEVLNDLARDQLGIADRVGKLIMEQGGTMPSGQFPDRFSTLHDLAFDFLLTELICYQDRTIATIEACIPRLTRCFTAQTLAQEALGMAKAHRDILGELQRDLAGKPV